jgi:hypothetical protein
MKLAKGRVLQKQELGDSNDRRNWAIRRGQKAEVHHSEGNFEACGGFEPFGPFRGKCPRLFGGVGRSYGAFDGGEALTWAAARRTQFGPGCHILGFQPSLSPAGVESPAVTDRRYREDSNARRARSELERDAAFTIHYSPFLHLTGR